MFQLILPFQLDLPFDPPEPDAAVGAAAAPSSEPQGKRRKRRASARASKPDPERLAV